MMVDLLAALAEINGGRLPDLSRPVHPAHGCPCEPCTFRDDRLEDIAIERSDYR